MDPHNTSGSGPPQSALELHDASTLKMRPYNKFESLAMLQQPLDAARDHDNDAASSTAAPDYAPKPVALNLHFRRTRLVLIAAGMISLIVAGCVFFMIGVELTTFGKTSMNSAEKDALVNRYNSYTGYVTTALGTPLSMFVTTTVSVVALQLMANHILTPEPNWKATFATLMATTAIGYLVSNGFNAMNVQARDMDITPVIAPGDLTAADFINASYYSMTSNITYSVPEASKGNPTTNTILRNLVLPRVFKAPLKCTISSNSTLILQDDAVLYGISQRDWMKAMLTQAVDAKTLQVIINPTNANANAKVKPQDMPMNASRAAFLVLNTMFLSSQFVPWGQNASWEDDDDLLTGYQTDATNPQINVSTAIIAGLLPRDTAATEETKRKWLLNSTGPVLTDRFQETTATVLTDIPMNMTQIKLSESITFDSLSFEIDVDPAKLTSVTVAANKTRYLNIRSTQCGPFPGHCLIAKRDQPPLKPVMPAELLYDAPAQIHAFSICLDENGTEALQSTVRLGKKLDDLNVNSCPSTADGSMLLVSVAKRLVADALLENMTATPAGLTASANSSVVVNLRKIYTFTVARLGWAMLNLSTEFGAVCRDPSSVACMGLTFDLDADDTGTEQKLVVGTKSLPVGYLTTPVYSAWASIARQRPITLVQTHEPLKELATASLVDEAGDILLPHNIKQINWGDKGTRVTGDQCSMYTEDRLQLVLNNHMYMEQSLQATYTAGMFFLFQKAVVRDVLNATTSKVGNITTLKFDQNIELMSVWLSMPTNNALLTLSGCVAIALGVLVVLLWPRVMAKKQAADPFTDITTAHVIAQVMLNEDAFPPLLVQRRVVHAVGVDFEKKSDEEDVDKFVIGSVALQPHEDRATRTSMA